MGAPSKDEIFDFSKTLVGDDAVGMLAKLIWEMRQIHEYSEGDPLVRAFLSYNAASTAWHTHEWLWKLCPENQREVLLKAVNAESKDFDGYTRGLQRSNGALAICRQIANAGKHVAVKYNRDDIQGEIHHDTETGATSVKYQWEGQIVDDLSVYLEALKVWMTIYVKLGYKRATELTTTAKDLGLIQENHWY